MLLSKTVFKFNPEQINRALNDINPDIQLRAAKKLGNNLTIEQFMNGLKSDDNSVRNHFIEMLKDKSNPTLQRAALANESASELKEVFRIEINKLAHQHFPSLWHSQKAMP